ncbi:hypothetical protein SEA_MAGRITTE_154 [Microbacterium phage Magritte]|nr:hypothetical protein SEA_MAGRITTE_154 [Microbacterium phage Magritte]
MQDARANRDDLIRDAKASTLPYSTIMRQTGLSRDRLIKIVHSPAKHEQDDR